MQPFNLFILLGLFLMVSSESQNIDVYWDTVSCGMSHSLATTQDGEIYSWGDGGHGRLGHGAEGNLQTTLSKSTPARINQPEFTEKVISVSAGHQHSLVLREDNQAFAFGYNNEGQIGYNGPAHSSNLVIDPVEVYQANNTVFIAAGSQHNIILDAGGAAYSFGSRFYGKLGLGELTENVVKPTRITASMDGVFIKHASCSETHSLMVSNQGAVYSFGSGTNGRLGLNSTTTHNVPQLIEALADVIVTKVAAASGASFALSEEGDVYSWGLGSFGVLGHGNLEDQWLPKKIETLPNIKDISASSHVMFLTESGQLYVSGSHAEGKLCLGYRTTYLATPEILPNFQNVHSIAAGPGHSLFVTSDFKMYACGNNENFKTGLGKINGHNWSPKRVCVGNECLQCDGKDMNDPDICSGHGNCVRQDQCVCSSGWTGSFCDSGHAQDDDDTNPDHDGKDQDKQKSAAASIQKTGWCLLFMVVVLLAAV